MSAAVSRSYSTTTSRAQDNARLPGKSTASSAHRRLSCWLLKVISYQADPLFVLVARRADLATAPPPSGFRKQRNSILVAAGDVLGFSKQRKRFSRVPAPLPRQAETVDEVLEISALRDDEVAEVAERERLRGAAAQAVGLSPAVEDSLSVHSNAGPSGFIPSPTTAIPPPAPFSSPLPPHPCRLSDLHPFVQHSSVLLKYVAAPSPFLVLSKSRQWKLRALVMTSIRPIGEKESTESHLHLFKSTSGDERELERLLIHQDSLIYIADDELAAGRKHVVKVVGKAVGSPRTAKPSSEVPTVWLLQMPDQTQMQRWIQFIKSTVLMQRYVWLFAQGVRLIDSRLLALSAQVWA